MKKTTAPGEDEAGHVNRVWKQRVRRRLLAWFDRHARDLPWRQTRDPYAIWVSEVMLQQTQVATVVDYYRRFLQAFPTVQALAAAEEQQVLRMWEGLGYYRRARQLHQAAQQVVHEHQGQFPRNVDQVRKLPGIGRYTAGAILSIAFDARQPILEANTLRVFSRLLAYAGNPRSAAGQQVLWELAEILLPQKRAGAFNQALMELGSEICTPRHPACPRCPLQMLCPTYARGLQHQIPQAPKKTVYEEVQEVAVVVYRKGQVLLRQCQEGERWAGLWDFPRFPLAAPPGQSDQQIAEYVQRRTGIVIATPRRLTEIKHGVTRYRITLFCYQAQADGGRLTPESACRWIRPAALNTVPLSVTGRKISRLLATS